MDNCRKISVDIIQNVLKNGGYSNIVLKDKLNQSDLNDLDKSLVTEIVYGTLRRKYTIDKIIKYFVKNRFDKVDDYILDILRISIYQIEYLKKVPSFAAVNEGVELAKQKSFGASKFVNGVLRNFLRNRKAQFFDASDRIEEICYVYSLNKWMAEFFINQYGIEVSKRIFEGFNKVPDVTVRCNLLKSDVNGIKKYLTDEGYTVEEPYMSKNALRIEKGKSIEKNVLYKKGFITVQDESAMAAVECMDLKDNLKVMDLCSAPGGKATYISEIMNNTGCVNSFDIYKNKLNLINKNAKRLGITNIKAEIMDASEFNENFANCFDRVLADVPCSGLGAIRKKPEIKWNKSLNDMKNIIKKQKLILSNASKYLNKDGILVYSTCTLNKDENESIIKWFLKNNPDFKSEKLHIGEYDNILYNDIGNVTILPNKKVDGFFIAKLRKIL